MELKTNATGGLRKQLVSEITAYLNTPMCYDGAPSFSYTVGDYRIDREGTVTGPGNPALLEALAARGFTVN